MHSLQTFALVVAALHIIILGFLFFKPPLNYFTVICLSTIIVWAAVFALVKRRRWVGITAGLLLQIAIQQAAYHAWLSGQISAWWPLAQFLSVQYLVVLRLGTSPDDDPPPFHGS